jgi:hypothetical protein
MTQALLEMMPSLASLVNPEKTREGPSELFGNVRTLLQKAHREGALRSLGELVDAPRRAALLDYLRFEANKSTVRKKQAKDLLDRLSGTTEWTTGARQAPQVSLDACRPKLLDALRVKGELPPAVLFDFESQAADVQTAFQLLRSWVMKRKAGELADAWAAQDIAYRKHVFEFLHQFLLQGPKVFSSQAKEVRTYLLEVEKPQPGAAVAPPFEKGEDVQVWSNGQQRWVKAMVTGSYRKDTEDEKDGERVTVPAGSVKVLWSTGEKYVKPDQQELLRKIPAEGMPQQKSVFETPKKGQGYPSPYCDAHDAQMWSEKHQQWLPARVIESFEYDDGHHYCEIADELVHVAAGTIKVESEAGYRYVKPYQQQQLLRNIPLARNPLLLGHDPALQDGKNAFGMSR